MQFSDKMIEVKHELEKLGHDAITCGLIDNYIGKENEEVVKQKEKDRSELSATKKFWARMVDREAILILNFDAIC